MKHVKLFEQFIKEENYQSPYIKNEKVTGKVYHVAGNPIKSLNNRPMWFALRRNIQTTDGMLT